jgi:hypothetical protein
VFQKQGKGIRMEQENTTRRRSRLLGIVVGAVSGPIAWHVGSGVATAVGAGIGVALIVSFASVVVLAGAATGAIWAIETCHRHMRKQRPSGPTL